MLTRLSLTFSLLIAGSISLAWAGSSPEGFSSVKGYFLGFEEYAYLSVSEENSKPFVTEIEALCKGNGKLWALGISSPFECTGFRYIEEGGFGPVYRLDIKSTAEIKTHKHALLFSIKPFPPPSWTKRTPTRAEIDNYVVASLSKKKYSKALRNAKAGKGTAIEAPNHATIFIIPWRTANDYAADITEEELLVIARGKTGAYEAIEVRGRIVGFADINNDGIPELQISTHCDGICESVISIVREKPIRVDISVH